VQRCLSGGFSKDARRKATEAQELDDEERAVRLPSSGIAEKEETV
jgi:hypothetical protein